MDKPPHFSTWNNRQVVSWLKGLDESLSPYLPLFKSVNVNGKWLVSVHHNSLVKLGVEKVGAQILILEGIINLTHQFCYMDSENLQIIIHRVEFDAMSVVTGIQKRQKLAVMQEGKCDDLGEEAYTGILKDISKLSSLVLAAVPKLKNSIEQASFWIDRSPFANLTDLLDLKKLYLQKMTALTKAAQMVITSDSAQKWKDMLSNAEEILKKSSDFVQSCKDSLYITPCTLELVQIKKEDNVEFPGFSSLESDIEGHLLSSVEEGINIRSTAQNIHIVDSIVSESPAYKTGRIDEGDEIIQVNEHIVIGWHHRSVVEEMRSNARHVTLILRKRPSHNSDGSGYPGNRRYRNPNTPNQKKPVLIKPRKPGGSHLLPEGRNLSPSPNPGEFRNLFGGSSLPTIAGSPSPLAGRRRREEKFIPNKRRHGENEPTIEITSEQGDVSPARWPDYPTPKTSRAHNSQGTPQTATDEELSDSELAPANHTKSTQSKHDPIPSKTHSGSRSNLLSAVDEEDGLSQASSTLKREPATSVSDMSDIQIRTKNLGHARKTNRRISCKDLGQGDCQGWLYLRKSERIKSTWAKRWCVLKHGSLYYYRNVEDNHAEGLVNLHGFTICPVAEVKSSKYAFKIFRDYVTFTFASESETDRSKWMNKLQLAAIGYDISSNIPMAGFRPGYNPSSPRIDRKLSADVTRLGNSPSAPGTPVTSSRKHVSTGEAPYASNNKSGDGYFSVSENEEEENDKPVQMRLEKMVPSILNAARQSYTISMIEREETSQNRLLKRAMQVRKLEKTIADKEDQLKKIDEFLHQSTPTKSQLQDFLDNYSYILESEMAASSQV